MQTCATFYRLSSWSLQGSLPLSNSSETLIAVDSGDGFIYLALKGGPVVKDRHYMSLLIGSHMLAIILAPGKSERIRT